MKQGKRRRLPAEPSARQNVNCGSAAVRGGDRHLLGPLNPEDLARLFFSVATPAEPRGEKKHFFVQVLGGENF